MRFEFLDGQVLMWTKGNTIDDAVVIREKEGRLYKLKGQPEEALVHDSVVDVFVTLECIHQYILCIVPQCLF